MISDYEAASICRATYAYKGDPPFAWDHFFTGDSDAADTGVCWCLLHREFYDIVAFRGSVTPQDWLRDFNAAAWPVFRHFKIGWVHAGFYDKLPKVWEAMQPMLMNPVVVVGHSLGAARASILAAMMVVDGYPVAQRAVFGEPRPGFAKLGKVLEAVPRSSSYRAVWGADVDPVTKVPFKFGPWQYVHPTKMIEVPVRPHPGDPWGELFALHHIQGYQEALRPKP